jgi:serine/threonine-protein kinase
MVMEFVRGETLDRLVERMGPLSPQRAAELCMQTLAALAHAHSMGVVHRDLKPANVMITETGAIKIMDFGIARVAGTEHLTSAGFMMGTPAYMAPEQVMGQDIDARADLYAMGVVFYRLTTARLPFKGETPFAMAQSQVNDPPTPIGLVRTDLPSWVEQVVVRSLAKNKEERFQSAIEFHESLARCLSGLPMAPTFGSTAQTELMPTPSRLQSGAYHRSGTGQIPSSAMPVDSGSLPTIGTPTPMRSPSQAIPAGAAASGSMGPAVRHSGTAPLPADEAARAEPAAAQPPRVAPPKRGLSGTAIAGAAAALLVVGIVAAVLMRGRNVSSPADAPITENAAPSTETAVAPAVPTTPVPATPPPAASPVPAPAPQPSGTTVADPAAARSGGARAAGAAARGTAAADATAPRPAPVDDTPESFAVKFVAVSGTKTSDRDVTLSFGSGQISAAPRDGGGAIFAVPYGALLHTTYVRGRDPRWNVALPGPPDKLDVGGVFRTSKHWLVLQGDREYWILRLEDINVIRILQLLNARTPVPVDRPRSDAAG